MIEAHLNRVRLQVCSGAHPRWMRNLQTGEPLATATRMIAATHRVRHGSVLSLPALAVTPELGYSFLR